jgi:hypothetical protein
MTQDIDYKLLAQELLGGLASKTKEVGSTPTALYGHGPGGLFSTPGLNKPLFSAMILPRMGVQSQLPLRPSNDTNPLYAIMTGVTATSGSEPVGVCDDPKTTGTMKLCIHSFVFGRFSRMSKVYDIDRVGQITNRGEFMDLQLMNNPFAQVGGNPPTSPTMPGFDASRVAQNEVAKALFEMGVAWARDFARVIYTGNPANNTAGGGYKEFNGFDILINTGYRDAETGNLCPAADSIVRTFGNLNVSANAAAFVRNVTNIYRNLKFLAVRAGLDPIVLKIAMTFGMFYEVTEVWPIVYLTYRALAIPAGGQSINYVDAADVEKMREDMRANMYDYSGQYLLIDGQKVPVIIDDAITETENGDGSFTASLYFIPFTVLGGTPVTFLEYFNYDGPNGSLEFAKLFAPGDSYYTTDNGRFMWHKKPPTNFCVQILAKTEPRLLLLTPYIAARLTNIRYLPLEHERSPFTESSYWVDGGNTTYPAPSLYTPIYRAQ